MTLREGGKNRFRNLLGCWTQSPLGVGILRSTKSQGKQWTSTNYFIFWRVESCDGLLNTCITSFSTVVRGGTGRSLLANSLKRGCPKNRGRRRKSKIMRSGSPNNIEMRSGRECSRRRRHSTSKTFYGQKDKGSTEKPGSMIESCSWRLNLVYQVIKPVKSFIDNFRNNFLRRSVTHWVTIMTLEFE